MNEGFYKGVTEEKKPEDFAENGTEEGSEDPALEEESLNV